MRPDRIPAHSRSTSSKSNSTPPARATKGDDMRRFFLILTPVLLLALAACGGNTNKQADVAPTPEPRVLAEGSGLADGQPPRAAQQPQVLVSQPDKPVEGLTISDITATVGSDGTVLIAGKVGISGERHRAHHQHRGRDRRWQRQSRLPAAIRLSDPPADLSGGRSGLAGADPVEANRRPEGPSGDRRGAGRRAVAYRPRRGQRRGGAGAIAPAPPRRSSAHVVRRYSPV